MGRFPSECLPGCAPCMLLWEQNASLVYSESSLLLGDSAIPLVPNRKVLMTWSSLKYRMQHSGFSLVDQSIDRRSTRQIPHYSI